MIPVSLQISGFLSYNQPIQVDFSQFELACISGANGAGKSSLLDAITWALFGQARRRDDAIINSRSATAEVIFIFDYEGNRYRIQRSKTINKSTLLEFTVQDPDSRWRPLTEHTVRETEDRIVQTLRMDFETFTNASFFLQGRADQFAQQRPGDRKRILSSVLGLEMWETYRETAAERRKNLETELTAVDARLEECDSELNEEDQRRTNLRLKEEDLAQAEQLRKSHQDALEMQRQLAASLEQRKNMVELLKNQAVAARQRWQDNLDKLTERREEQAAYQAPLARAVEIEADYQRWQETRTELERRDALAANFNQFQQQRAAPVALIQAEQARLEQELKSFNTQLAQARDSQTLREIELKRLNLEVSDSLQTEETYTLWKQYRTELDQWEELAKKFHELQSQRNTPLLTIENEKARLEQELVELQKQGEQAATIEANIAEIQGQISTLKVQFTETSRKVERRQELEEIRQVLQQTQSNSAAEVKRLHEDMKALRARIEKIQESAGADCPLCGQPMTQEHSQKLIVDLEAEGQALKERYLDHQDTLKDIETNLALVNNEFISLRTIDGEARQQQAKLASLQTRLEGYQQAFETWEARKNRLKEIQTSLSTGSFAAKEQKVLLAIDRDIEKLNYNNEKHQQIRKQEEQARASEKKYSDIQAAKARIDVLSKEIAEANRRIQEYEQQLMRLNALLISEDYAKDARAELARIDSALLELGYDAAGHDALRRDEQAARASQDRLRELETARARLVPVQREITSLEKQVKAAQKEAAAADAEFLKNEEAYRVAEAALPDLITLESELRSAQERANQLRAEAGGLRQKVEVLVSVRARKKALTAERENNASQIAQLKKLERAFGKDGIPALLIEQALPEIEEEANKLLDRLSNGAMSVHFETQGDYKDKKREDKKETLDITIIDSYGKRDYELFSGGEAFRVNFAIRLALSHVLAQRAGARLQTLVIDEGFGSQDADGRQRLIEAINLVSSEFAKILVITHLEELKDAFPARIEVEKTAQGSSVKVVAP